MIPSVAPARDRKKKHRSKSISREGVLKNRVVCHSTLENAKVDLQVGVHGTILYTIIEHTCLGYTQVFHNLATNLSPIISDDTLDEMIAENGTGNVWIVL